MRQIARLHYLRIAPRKVRSVTDLVKGLSANEAEAQLMLNPRRPAKSILKLLRSAVAGAKARNANVDSLYLESVLVDKGPMLKRSLPRARGMATPIHKVMSHITLVLNERNVHTHPRFSIVIKKKVKATSGEKKTKRKKPTLENETSITKGREKGFWKRMFRRKSV